MTSRCAVVASCLVMTLSAARLAAEPVDRELIPEARRVLDYLASVHGKKTLAGMSSYGGRRPIQEMSGRLPAIYAHDIFGWNKPVWGESYRRVLEGVIDESHSWWHERGGIVSLQYHWGKPGDPEGSAWVGGGRGTGPVDVAKTVTPGTPEHAAAMEDLGRTADHLERLARERVPVLWRPLHEIDGGWFWWTDVETPENTAALWRMIFEYLVSEREIHNLIWVYSAGLKPGNLERGAPRDEEIAYRRRFYPGKEYVDIAGIDIYPNSWYGWPGLQESSYARGFELMSEVAPGKMIALCESAGIPSPDLIEARGPAWLYALPWFAGGNGNSADWIRHTFRHAQIVTLDELPPLAPHNVAPVVRIDSPLDGSAHAAAAVEISGQAIDRDGNLRRVEILELETSWRNWSLRDDEELTRALRAAKTLGTAEPGEDGGYRLRWSDPPTGLSAVVAVAHDTDGARAASNVARITVGLTDLAHGRPVSASTDEDGAPAAVDGDLFTSWSGSREGPQWLRVDLGERAVEVGGVVVSWWKAYARDYLVEISADGESWSEAARVSDKRDWHGDTDVFRFRPVPARFLRIRATRPGTDWGGHVVQEVRVFARLPVGAPG